MRAVGEFIKYDVSDGVATITFNRPDKLNAMHWPMIRELGAAWAEAIADDDARCVLVCGEGKAYCVGDDIKQAWSGEHFDALMLRFVERPEERESTVQFELRKPVVGAIHGYCLGGAMELSLWFDILIAADDAQFGANFVEFGLTGGATTFWRLPRLVGHSSAGLLLLAGERIGAEEALRMGLVSRVVRRQQLLPEARRLAKRIASFDAETVRKTKRARQVATGATLEGQQDLIAYANRMLAEVFAGRG